MKTLLTIVLLAIIPTLSYGQYTKTERTTKTIVQQRAIYLNGGLRASVGGKSRVVIPFDLPKNTVEWYYSFSTDEGTSGTKNLNLAIQLSSFLVDQTGTTSTFMKQVEVPGGSSSIDVFLLNTNSQTAFIEKWDNNGGSFSYITEGTTQNTKQAVVRVDDVKSGRCHIGLKNPSSLDGVNVFVEVIAITQSEVYVDEWTSESKGKLKTNCLEVFHTESLGKNDVCECFVDKITNQNLPSEWDKQSSNSRQAIKKSELENCFNETGNTALRNAELEYQKRIKKEREELERSVNNVSTIIKESQAASTMGDYPEARDKTLSAIDLIINNPKLKERYDSKQTANLYNSAAWFSILLNELEPAGEYLKKGLANNNQDMYLRGNLGLFHLLKGNYTEAEKAFLYYKRKQKLPSGDKWVNVIEEDLNLLESKGMGNPDFNRIRKLMKIK